MNNSYDDRIQACFYKRRHLYKTPLSFLGFILGVLLLTPLAYAAPPGIPPGSVVVVDSDSGTGLAGALFLLDGARSVLSDFGDDAQGPFGVDPFGAVVTADGQVLVTDRDAGTGGRGALFTVDGTGARSVLSDFGDAASGPLGVDPAGIAVEADGRILVVDPEAGSFAFGVRHGALFRVDPATGARTLLTDFNTSVVNGVLLHGGDVGNPTGVAIEPGGSILIADPGDPGRSFSSGSGGLFRVDPASGAVIVLYANPFFPETIDPIAVLSDPNGPLVLDAARFVGLVRFVNCSAFSCPDPVTVSDFADPALGPLGVEPTGMARGAAGEVLAVDPEAGTGGAGALFLITPRALRPLATLGDVNFEAGKRSLLSDFGDPATGPVGVNPVGVAADLRRVPAADGDVLVVDPAGGPTLPGATSEAGGAGLVIVVKPDTGRRMVLSDFGSLAEGPVGEDPRDVALESDGQVLVVDSRAGTDKRGALFRVDPETGRRVVLSDFGDPQQGELGIGPIGVAVERDGRILVVNQSPPLLFRVDPADGRRTVLTDFAGFFPNRVAVEGDGHILVTDFTGFHGGQLFRVDPTSGAATVLSDLGDGATSTPPGDELLMGFARGVTVEQDGNILLAMLAGQNTVGLSYPVLRVDPDSGIRSAAATSPVVPAFDVAVESSNAILLLTTRGSLIRVDPATGIGLVLSNFAGAPTGIAVVGAPQLPPPPPPPDTTPPVITPTVLGTLGTNGWYTSDVSVSWSVTDPESSITTQSGCGATSVTADTAGITFTCEARSAGGTNSKSVTIQRDATAPSLAPSVSPNPVTLNGSATASPNASDALSGIATSGCDPVDTTSVGPKTVSCTATDQAGNSANALANYTVTATPLLQTTVLIATVEGLPVPPAVKLVLKAPLLVAKAALQNNRPQAACGSLRVFEGIVRQLRQANKLTAAQATQLTGASQSIRTTLGCP